MVLLMIMSALPEILSTGSLPPNPEGQEGNADVTTTATNSTSVPPRAIGNDTKYTVMLVLIGLVCAVTLLFVLSFVYVTLIRSKCKRSCTKSRHRKDSEGREIYQNTNTKSSEKSRQREDSEGSTVYQNTNTKPNVNNWNSMKTHMYRPLPELPVEGKPSVDTIDGRENNYLVPNSPFRYGYEEIRNLPPAPPVFPKYLANLPLEGEGSYLSVISDDEAQLLSPSSPCEISLDENSSEMCEENGYVHPRQIRKISVEMSSSETEFPETLNEIKDNTDQKSMRVSPDMRSQRAPKECQYISECKLYNAKDISTTNIAEIKSETSNDEKVKTRTYRSALQIHLSPLPQPRPLSVTTRTSKGTVVVCIHTDL
jgi:hypothetical protein